MYVIKRLLNSSVIYNFLDMRTTSVSALDLLPPLICAQGDTNETLLISCNEVQIGWFRYMSPGHNSPE